MSYLHDQGYLEAGGGNSAAAGGISGSVLDGDGGGEADGPLGSAQGWCKDGLAARTDANTGEMVCVPDGYADEDAGSRWIESPGGESDGDSTGADSGARDGAGRIAGRTANADAARQEAAAVAGHDAAQPPYAGNGYARAYEAGLMERIADLEDLNDGLLRTVARLQEALMENHMAGGGGAGGAVAGSSNGGGGGGAVTGGGMAAAAATAGPENGGICLHGTDASFSAVIDPDTLAEAGGVLGTIPVPEGRYTVLLTAVSSAPVSVRVHLSGDAGLSYDRKFVLEDTGRPQGEGATMRDYNSGRAELVVGEPQTVNASAIVYGGDGMPVFASVSKCR